MSEGSCRIDVWLWRARFFKTRGLAARMVEDGRIRLSRGGGETRLDKPSRTIKPGDGLVFALGEKVIAVRVEDLGERRGRAAEAQALYSPLQNPCNSGQKTRIDIDATGRKKAPAPVLPQKSSR